jgi:hypothetical protein
LAEAARRAHEVEEHYHLGLEWGFLESTRVKTPTTTLYDSRVWEFLQFVQVRQLAFKDVTDIDAAFSRYFDSLYACGDHHSIGRGTLAGFLHFYTEFGRDYERAFVRAKNALTSWEKKEPALSKSPLLWEGACAIACILSSEGHEDMAIYVLVQFDTFARPTELLWLRLSACIPSVPHAGFEQWAVRLNPTSQLRSSKVGAFDEIIPLSAHRWQVSDLLAWYVDVCHNAGAEFCFNFDYDDISRCFVRAAFRANLGKRSLYDGRHGGASDDAALGFEDGYLARRGRWASLSSVARYSKPGILQESWSQLSPETSNFILECEAKVLQVVTGQQPCPSLPAR